MTVISVGYDTHRGMQREENQDYAMYRMLKNTSLFRNGVLMVLADGMGGHAGGSVASKMAVETVLNEFYPQKKNQINRYLENCFFRANDLILDRSHEDPNLKGMGTTLTAVVIQNDQLFFAHVGDSRGYIISDTEIFQLTEDHTYVADLLKQGLITQHEAENHPYDNIITRAIGVSPNPMVDHNPTPMKIKAKQAVLLCSDGLHKCLKDKEIQNIVRKNEYDPDEACRELIFNANQRGGPDNITVMIAYIKKVSSKSNWLEKIWPS